MLPRGVVTSAGEIFGHDWSLSGFFQVQPVTCCDLSVFFKKLFEVCSIDSSEMISDFPES